MSVEWYIYIYRLMFELWVASACGHLCTTRTRAKIHQTKLAVCSAVDISFNCMGSVPLECAFMRICGSWSWMWIVLREQSMILHKWGYTQHDERELSSVFSQEDEIKLWTAGRRNYVNVVYISASRKYKNSPTYLCQHPKWSVELILVRITDFGKVKSTSWLMAPKCSCIEISPCIQSQVLSYFIHSHWHWNGTTVAFGEIIVADDIHRLGAS